MKTRVLTLIAMFAMLFGGAQAQTLSAGGALTLNFVNGVTVFGIRGVFNADSIGGRGSVFGLRGTFDFVFVPGIDIGIGADAFAKLRAGVVDPYFGAGARLYFINGLAITIQGLAGLDVNLSAGVDLFAEFQPGIYLVPATGGSAFIAGLTVGVRARL